MNMNIIFSLTLLHDFMHLQVIRKSLCLQPISVPRVCDCSSRHRVGVPWVVSVPRVAEVTLGKAALCREITFWLSAQNRALGRGCVSGSALCTRGLLVALQDDLFAQRFQWERLCLVQYRRS
jgi:hypothetical protein